jgi:hypothetical protein
LPESLYFLFRLTGNTISERSSKKKCYKKQ